MADLESPEAFVNRMYREATDAEFKMDEDAVVEMVAARDQAIRADERAKALPGAADLTEEQLVELASASKSVEALASRLLDLLPGVDKERACELIRADRRAVIVSVCKWLESRGAHPRDGRMFAAEDVLHNITDPGEPFEDLGFGSLVQEQSDD